MANLEFRKFNSNRAFGIELEAGVEIDKNQVKKVINSVDPKREILITEWQQTEGNNYWNIKQDSTCGKNAHTAPGHKDYGWEIASFRATEGLTDIETISKASNALYDAGLRANNNCGFHIHAEIKDFTGDSAGIMLARWIKIEPIIAMLVPVRRIRSKHCRLWAKSRKYDANVKYSARDFWKLLRPTNFNAHQNRQKKVSLNFVNFAYALSVERDGGHYNRKTVEFRLPEGTLCGEDIKFWIIMFLLFVDNCVGQAMPENFDRVNDLNEFFSYFGLGHGDNFYLFDEVLHNTKIWMLQRIKACDRAVNRCRIIRQQSAEILAKLVNPKPVKVPKNINNSTGYINLSRDYSDVKFG